MERRQILIVGNDPTLYHPIRKRMMVIGVDVYFSEPSADVLTRVTQQKYYLVMIDIRTCN